MPCREFSRCRSSLHLLLHLLGVVARIILIRTVRQRVCAVKGCVGGLLVLRLFHDMSEFLILDLGVGLVGEFKSTAVNGLVVES